MKTKSIPLEKAFSILSNARAVVIDGALTVPDMDKLTGEPDNQFARIEWDDPTEGLEFSVSFSEGNNRDIPPQVNGSTLLLTDDEGNPVEITILVGAKL